jgi:hypothetical protein
MNKLIPTVGINTKITLTRIPKKVNHKNENYFFRIIRSKANEIEMIVIINNPLKKIYEAIDSYFIPLSFDFVCIDENEKKLLKAKSITHNETISPIKLS